MLFTSPVSSFNFEADRCIQLRLLSKFPCSAHNLNHVLITMKIHAETRRRLLERGTHSRPSFLRENRETRGPRSTPHTSQVSPPLPHSLRATICNELSSGV